jgi:hypothetical protein
MKWTLLLGTALLVSAGSATAQYRCIENGKTVITDRPCANEVVPAVPTGNVPKIIGDRENSAYSSPYGDWRGDVQLQLNQNGQLVAEAHTVAPMTISINPQGKIQLAAPKSGCTGKGVAAPYMGGSALSLDVTFAGCQVANFNKRMHGHLLLNPRQRVAQLSLSVMKTVPLMANTEFVDVKATLRR